MRAALVCTVLCVGCGFDVPAATGVPPGSHDDAAVGSEPVPSDAPELDAFAPACWTDPSYAAGPDGHRYKKGATTPWDDAVDTCAADGAHLAQVDSQAENDYLKGLDDDGWIGLDDLTTEDDENGGQAFHWITGAPLAFKAFTGNEPNNANGDEDCVYVDSQNGHWNDTNCDNGRPAYCECELGYVAPPRPACRAMAGATVEYGRKYFLHTTPATYAAAVADCASIGAYLFVPEDDTENDAVDQDFIGNSWIGITDAATEGTWVWNNGSTDTYRKWYALGGNPHADNQRNCAYVYSSWNDVSCTDPQPYACECDPLATH